MCDFLFNFSITGEFKNFKEELFVNRFNTIIHRGPDENGFIFKKIMPLDPVVRKFLI